jgi:DnaK suppressor protein
MIKFEQFSTGSVTCAIDLHVKEARMKKTDLNKFKKILDDRRNEILDQAATVKEPVFTIEVEDLPDEVDLASSESDQSMNIRLRDREQTLLKKINKALEKIDNGSYGVCESCGEDISVRRLEARPVTDLCIRCKEEQERVERSFAEE